MKNRLNRPTEQRDTWKNGRFDRDAVYGGRSGGTKERRIRWGSSWVLLAIIRHNGLWLLTVFCISGFVLVPCGRLSWLLPAFDRTLISHSYLLTYLLNVYKFRVRTRLVNYTIGTSLVDGAGPLTGSESVSWRRRQQPEGRGWESRHAWYHKFNGSGLTSDASSRAAQFGDNHSVRIDSDPVCTGTELKATFTRHYCLERLMQQNRGYVEHTFKCTRNHKVIWKEAASPIRYIAPSHPPKICPFPWGIWTSRLIHHSLGPSDLPP